MRCVYTAFLISVYATCIDYIYEGLPIYRALNVPPFLFQCMQLVLTKCTKGCLHIGRLTKKEWEELKYICGAIS